MDDDCLSIRKNACWALSNITAGTPEQVYRAIKCEIVPKLIKCANKEENKFIQVELTWVL
eukprot:Pgem_evm1s13234